MWIIRYSLVFVSQFLFDFTSKNQIGSLGYKTGSMGALLSWCNTNAKFSAKWKHPLRICIRRDLFPVWMMEDNMDLECEGCQQYGSGACYALGVTTSCCNQPNGPLADVVTVSNSSVDEQNGLDSTTH